MLKETTILTIFWLLTSFFVAGQTTLATTEFYSQGRQISFYKGNLFNSWLVVTDSLTNDTIEYDKQISQNRSVSILYEQNRPKYKMYCKAYYDKEARKIKKKERHHHFLGMLNDLHIKRYMNFFPVFYYSKSAKIKSRQILVNNKWKHHTDKNLKPTYALFDSDMIAINRKIRSKF